MFQYLIYLIYFQILWRHADSGGAQFCRSSVGHESNIHASIFPSVCLPIYLISLYIYIHMCKSIIHMRDHVNNPIKTYEK